MQTPKQNTPEVGEHNYNPMQSARALSNAGMDNTLAQALTEQIADAHNKGRREFLDGFARVEQRFEEGRKKDREENREILRGIQEAQEKSEQRLEEAQKESEQRLEEAQKESEQRLEKAQKESERRLEEAQKKSEQRLEKMQKESERRFEKTLEKSEQKLQEAHRANINEARVEFHEALSGIHKGINVLLWKFPLVLSTIIGGVLVLLKYLESASLF